MKTLNHPFYILKSLFAAAAGAFLVSCTPLSFVTADSPAVQEELASNIGTGGGKLSIALPMSGTEVATQITLEGSCNNEEPVLISGDLLTNIEVDCLKKRFQAAVVLSEGDGEKTVRARQDKSNRSDSKVYIKDGTAPQITLSSPVANAYVRSQLSVAGTCENGLEVYVRVGEQVQSTSCVDSMYAAVMATLAADGPVQVQISQRDRVGNIGYAAQNLRKDTMAPNVTISSPAANAQVGASVSVAGSCENGLPVVIAGAGLTASTSVTCSAGSYSQALNLTAGDGSKLIEVSQVDAAGNRGQVSRTLLRDSSAPNLTITAPAANSYAVNGLTLVGTCEVGRPISIAGAGVSATLTATCASSGSFSQALTFSAGEGNKVVTATQVDASGNQTQVSRTFIKDSVRPVLQISSPIANATVTSPVQILGSCEAGTDVNLSGAGLVSATSVLCAANATFSVQASLSAGNGTKTISFNQTDRAGNAATAVSLSLNRQELSPAPEIRITSPAANTLARTSLTVAGTCQTGLTVNISGGVATASTAACTSGQFSATVTLSAVDGNKSIMVAQTNSSGTTGSDTRIFIKDETPPTVSISSPVANAVVSTATVSLMGACQAGLSVSISGAGVAANSTTTCSAGSFTSTVSLSSGDGNKLIQVSQTDSAGNVGTVSRTIVRDTVAPVLAFTSPAANQAATTGVTIAGTCESGLNITVAGAGVMSSGTTACTTGSFSYALTFSSGEGNKAVEISQTDAAGNRGSVSRTFVRDSVAPALAFTSPAANAVGDSGLTIAGSCETGLVITIAGTGVASSTTTNCNSGAFSQAISFSGGDGNKAVEISQTDAAGNRGAVSRTFVRQTTATPASRFLAAKQVLQNNCTGCHYQGGSAVSFNLDTEQMFIEQGFVVAGSLDRSKLIYRLQNYPVNIAGRTMPPSGPLVQNQYDILAQWVLNMPGSSNLQNYFSCNSAEEPDTLNARRLSKTQLYNSLHGLLSRPFGTATATAQMSGSSSFFNDRVPNDSKSPYSRSDSNMDYLHAKSYFDIADELATWMVNSARYATFVNTYIRYNQGSCVYTNPDTLDVTCRTVFLRNFLLRAWGRPVEENNNNSNNELSAYLAEFTLAGSNTVTWVNNVVFKTLTSPSFLMAVNPDVTLQSGNIYQLSDYAVARRLSLNYMQSGLDEGLLAIVQNSSLSSSQKFTNSLNYVMARVEPTVRDFTDEWLKLYKVPSISNQNHAKFARIAPNVNLADTNLVPAMRTELQDLLAYLNKNNRPVTEILTSNVSFAQNANLRAIYGQSTSAPSWSTTTESNAVRFPANERSGVLSRAGFLLSGSYAERLIIRGVHVRDQILCRELSGTVPPNASDTPLPATDTMTTRQKYDAITAGASCTGCHSQINPAGFALASYNALGGYQTQEPIFNSAGEYVRDLSVDSMVNLLTITGDTSDIRGGVEYAAELAQSRDFKRCLTQTFYSYFNAMAERSRAQSSCAMRSMYQVIDDGGTVNDFLKAAAQGANFQLRKIVKD